MSEAMAGLGPSPKVNVRHLTWEWFDHACAKVATEILQSNLKPSGVFGIPRGGLFVAARLSYMLDIPMVHDRKAIAARTLVADDISDSGGTLKDLFAFLPPFERSKVVCLQTTANTDFRPDFWYEVKEADVWTVFPWEAGCAKDTVSKVRPTA